MIKRALDSGFLYRLYLELDTLLYIYYELLVAHSLSSKQADSQKNLPTTKLH